jgi:23S rRNA (guanosine2251-2'-O)-methyltransferase
MADLIEGRNPVLEALKAGRPLSRIIIADNVGQNAVIGAICTISRSQQIPIEYVKKENLDRFSLTHNHQGIIAFAALKKYVAIEDLLEISGRKNEMPLYCVLDGIEDPQNFGAIVRTADASGIHGVIIRSHRAVGVTAAVSRASAGAVEYVPIAMVANISQAIEKLKKQNIWVVGIDMEGEIEYSKVDYTLPTAIVIGNEGKGLSDLVRKRCDYLVSIPMKGSIGSLNASIASALVMYEAFRQRRK